MPYSNEGPSLRIELDAKNCNFSPEALDDIQQALNPVRDLIRDFPVSDLYVTIYFGQRNNEYRVKTALVLPGRTLATGDHDPHADAAVERCARKLARRVEDYKEQMSGKPERAKVAEGTHQEVVPEQEPDVAVLGRAVGEGDYRHFRHAMFVYEEAIRKRIGRWVQRYPDLDARIGRSVPIADIVEEVFLNAFEQYRRRPASWRMGRWIESLIDPSIRALIEHPDEELENIEMVRSLEETEEGERPAE